MHKNLISLQAEPTKPSASVAASSTRLMVNTNTFKLNDKSTQKLSTSTIVKNTNKSPIISSLTLPNIIRPNLKKSKERYSLATSTTTRRTSSVKRTTKNLMNKVLVNKNVNKKLNKKVNQ